MQAVRHHDAIEWRQSERVREIRNHVRDRHRGEARGHRPPLGVEGAAVPVERDDLRVRAKQIREGERECAGTGAEIGPPRDGGIRAALRRARAQQGDVIRVFHRGQAGTDPVAMVANCAIAARFHASSRVLRHGVNSANNTCRASGESALIGVPGLP